MRATGGRDRLNGAFSALATRPGSGPRVLEHLQSAGQMRSALRPGLRRQPGSVWAGRRLAQVALLTQPYQRRRVSATTSWVCRLAGARVLVTACVCRTWIAQGRCPAQIWSGRPAGWGPAERRHGWRLDLCRRRSLLPGPGWPRGWVLHRHRGLLGRHHPVGGDSSSTSSGQPDSRRGRRVGFTCP
jgi:hypothetical protein